MLLSELNPISLQETFQKVDKSPKFSNYSYYSIAAEEVNGIAHGGIAMLIKNSTPHKQIQLNTSLQAIAVRTTLHKTNRMFLISTSHIEIQQFRFCRSYYSTSSTSLNPWRF